MKIDWWTLVLQAINFLVLIWLLSRFLYRPVREVIANRKAIADQAFEEAGARKKEAEAAKAEYETMKADLVQERQDLLKKIHGELEAERQETLDATDAEAEAMLDRARETIAQERAAALTDIRKHCVALASELASELLRNAGAGISSQVFLDRLEKYLGDMSVEETRHLQDDLAKTPDIGLTVATATPLASDEQELWRKKLKGWMHSSHQIRFIVDSDLLGGVELRSAHAMVKLTWRDQLQQAKKMLEKDHDAP